MTIKKKITIYPELEYEVKQEQKELARNKSIDFTEGLLLCKELATLQFWCGDNTLHQINPDYKDNRCCLTHTVGLPRHSATNEEMSLTPYQVEFCDKVIEITKAPQTADTEEELKKIVNDFLRLHHLFHLNKGRQMGFTEIVLRLMQFFCFSRYAGSNVGIIAATSGRLAHKDLRRFARLFKNIKPVVLHWIKIQKTINITVIELVNGTVIEAFRANTEAITGDTRYKCIFMDEAAKWILTDDIDVFNSIVPIVKAGGGDLFLVSTPKGRTKMFYKIWKDKESPYIKFEYNIKHAIGNMYTESQVDEYLAAKDLDPLQEYMCSFELGEGSVLRPVEDDERTTGWSHWGDDEFGEEEDDNYIENMNDYDEIHEKN